MVASFIRITQFYFIFPTQGTRVKRIRNIIVNVDSNQCDTAKGKGKNQITK